VSEPAEPSATEPLIIGRYALFDELASGGMATVHLGRLLGPVGFGRTVAVKRLHSQYLKDEEFITMFMDEARIVARIRHPNVVPMVDVVQSAKGLFLVMEYVHGESLSKLMRGARSGGERLPPRIVTAIMCNTLHGLHAAHETKGPTGELLGVVHRDVSPQNVIVGADGVARVLDFGIAKAAGRAQVTREGQIKGKLAYMAPEQIRGQVDRRTDIFAASVCLWEALTGRRLHEGLKDVEIVTRIVGGKFPPPSQFAPDVPPALDQIVLRGLVPDPKKRYSTAKEMALEIERNVGLATPTEVGAVVEQLASGILKKRQARLSAMEIAANDLIPDEAQLPPPSLAMATNETASGGGGAAGAAPPPPPPPPPTEESSPFDQADPFGQTHTTTHTQTTTTSGAALMSDLPAPPMNKVPITWIVMGACALLALVGLGLGGYAVLARPTVAAPTPPPSATATMPPPVAAPPSASVSPEHATPDTGHQEDTAVAADAGAAQASEPAPSASASASATSASASASAKHAPSPPSWAAPQPKAPVWQPPKRKGCDPPYTIDASGHKHYKSECFDQF
jgi:serine/threonine protein kinase